jgi:undecaprenyl-diphosphatase
MAPSLLQIVLLGLLQGAAEMLPVSSSAHVIVAEKLMGLDPTSPAMTFLLVMLHTGTMGAMIAYFWTAWRRTFFGSLAQVRGAAWRIGLATVATAAVYLALSRLAVRVLLPGHPGADVEELFDRLPLIAAALAAAGVLILVAGRKPRPGPPGGAVAEDGPIAAGRAVWIGAVQGVCLPFRGFSRSGATISTGMLLGVSRVRAEEFSFALAVVLTPPAIAREFLRLWRVHAAAGAAIGSAAGPAVHLGALVAPGLAGLVASFFAGLLALRWLSGWLERGRWSYFGGYCLAAAAVLAGLSWTHCLP